MIEHSDLMERSKDPIDSAPLTLKQLSDHELHLILQIERRLRDIQCSLGDPKPGASPRYRQARYLSPPESRYRRALLLDGARGTGKTSLLLTMAHRWTLDKASQCYESDLEECERRIEEMRKSGLATTKEELDPAPPEDVIIVGHILDFDPLPPAVPVIAGIVQAWRTIADNFNDERMSGYGDSADEENGTVLDLWHQLFRFSVVGWTDLPPAQGLIEQVLDRQEQVGDWHNLSKRWKDFLDRLIKSGGRCSSQSGGFSERAIFVIMIDDVDLQVGRIRQLLPALRMLYHERVVFLVAADREHMTQMLRATFYGQQVELARHHNAISEPLDKLIHAEPWSVELAQSSVEKVFARRNRWEVKRLSLREFLNFPRGVDAGSTEEGRRSALEETFLDSLESIPGSVKEGVASRSEEGRKGKKKQEPEDGTGGEGNAGLLIQRFESAATDVELGGVMTYRTAAQLHDYVQKFEPRSQRKGMEVLGQLISGSGEGEQAVVLEGPSIYLPIRGEIAALHRPGPTIQAGEYTLVLSSRPDFVYLENGVRKPVRISSEEGRHLNSTGLLVAKVLEELDFPVVASSLTWSTYLSHAWTEWSVLGKRLPFAWTRSFHPRPDEHLQQVTEWAEFVKAQRASRGESGNEDQQERWAYAWIYFQKEWRKRTPPKGVVVPEELRDGGKLDLKALCNEVNGLAADWGDFKWRRNTLALLARPELGFPLQVQEVLLEPIGQNNQGEGKATLEELKAERRRLVTDAFVAWDIQRGGAGEKLPTDAEVEQFVEEIDHIYEKGHGSQNHWKEIVEAVEV